MAPPHVPLRIALLGLGTVGGAVARWLMEERDAAPLELVAVGVRDPARDRGLRFPSTVHVTDDLAGLVDAAGVDVVVELLGGLEPAGALVEAALHGGRAVVTGNKALLAARGADLERCARETGSPLRFEAAVAGGIPILGPLGADLAADRFTRVRGIVNGTTNFILSAMVDEGREYADVLVDAQRRGYAEADPIADVAGLDAAAKLVILARLVFGSWQAPESVLRAVPAFGGGDAPPGITGVSAADISGARARGMRIRLVARGDDAPDGPRLAVTPAAVPEASLMGRTSGVTNLVELVGTPVGRLAFLGPGAGGAATSSSVVGDLLAVARGAGSSWGDRKDAAAPAARTTSSAAASLDGHDRWLVPRGDGSATIEEGRLDEVRSRLTGAVAADQPLYPVLEGD